MKEYRLRLGSREIPIRRTLQDAKPSTFVDGGGTRGNNRFQRQEISRDQLIEYKEIRESGGPIAAILRASGLLTFGTGTEWDVSDEELEQWLEENIPTRELDLFAIQAGTDLHTYPGVPIEVVENRAGEFSHFECVEPWTVIPITDDHGDIVAFRQEVEVNGDRRTKRLGEDELGYIVINRSNGRDKTGVSLLGQNMSEIEHYVETREATKNSAQLHGFPQRQIKVGREGMSPPNDNELRRIRQRFSRSWDELTMFVTGRDVEIDTLEATDFDFAGLTEDAVKTLMLSFLLPQELGNVGSDGLGSGMPAELRKELLMIGIEAKQRDFASQFVDQLVRPVVEEYSPHDPDDINRLKFKKPLENETDELERLEKKIDIGEKAAKNGLDVEFEAGDINIQGGEFDPDAGGEQPGGLDQIFNSKAEQAVESQLEGRELAEIPEKYTDGTGLSEDDFIPNSDVEDVVSEAADFIDKHGLPNPDDQREGAARVNQLLDHAQNNEPLEPEFWEEISNFHARHRAQNNHKCDESDLPEKATEIDNSEFEKCYFDNGWFSDKTWGGDPGKEQADRIVEAIESTEGVELGDSGNSYSAAELEEIHLEMWDRVIDTDETDRQLFDLGGQAVPEFVKDNIREAILHGSVFSEFDTIPSSELMNLRQNLMDALQEDGFTIDGVADQLLTNVDGLDSRERAELIARTETAASLNSARAEGYQELEEDAVFKWQGTYDDGRTTEACQWLLEQTNPSHGGTPVELKELQDLIEEAPEHDDDMQDDLARPDSFIVHPNERKTYVRHVE